ncbi:MAG: hypothetical protein SFU86_03575 [Pirellulaceae bacterium]|nr:hypothetical protein [Pirellulaceae bacterium]
MNGPLRSWIVGATILAVSAGCGGGATSSRPKQRPFDAIAWRAADPNSRSDREIRGSMVDDLIAQKLPDNLTMAEVARLLGAPISDRLSAGIDDPSWDIAYHLGPTRDSPIDEEFLLLRLNGEGKVAEYRVVPN